MEVGATEVVGWITEELTTVVDGTGVVLIGVLETNDVVGATLLLDGWTSVVGGAGDDEDSGGATLLDEGAT